MKDWLLNKLAAETFPKYNEKFNIDLRIKEFPRHLEIWNLHLLPEEKIKKIMNLFKWTEKKMME
ncbi:MAG: hypothetical protein ACTSSI_10140 [Candidatus Helarchaeota archaeon]